MSRLLALGIPASPAPEVLVLLALLVQTGARVHGLAAPCLLPALPQTVCDLPVPGRYCQGCVGLARCPSSQQSIRGHRVTHQSSKSMPCSHKSKPTCFSNHPKTTYLRDTAQPPSYHPTMIPPCHRSIAAGCSLVQANLDANPMAIPCLAWCCGCGGLACWAGIALTRWGLEDAWGCWQSLR